jgi:hypothetical protein
MVSKRSSKSYRGKDRERKKYSDKMEERSDLFFSFGSIEIILSEE